MKNSKVSVERRAYSVRMLGNQEVRFSCNILYLSLRIVIVWDGGLNQMLIISVIAYYLVKRFLSLVPSLVCRFFEFFRNQIGGKRSCALRLHPDQATRQKRGKGEKHQINHMSFHLCIFPNRFQLVPSTCLAISKIDFRRSHLFSHHNQQQQTNIF